MYWRSEGIEGFKLGEAVAISVLTDLRTTYNEDVPGFSLTSSTGQQ